MKKLKKLSLKKEIEREAEALEKEVSGRKDLDHITVSEDMEEALFQKIQDYEYEKRAKVVYRKKKKSYAIIAVAAVFILVFGSVMTGVGSKSYWKVWWDRDAKLSDSDREFTADRNRYRAKKGYIKVYSDCREIQRHTGIDL